MQQQCFQFCCQCCYFENISFHFLFLKITNQLTLLVTLLCLFFAKIDLFDELFSKNLIICAPSSARVFPSHTGLFTFKILGGVTLTTYLVNSITQKNEFEKKRISLQHQNAVYWCLYNFPKKQVKTFHKTGKFS